MSSHVTPEYSKKYYEANKEKIKEYQKKYNKENKEKVAKRHKEYIERTKEATRQRQKEWYEKNKEKILEERKQYRIDNIEKIRKYKQSVEYKKRQKELRQTQEHKDYLKNNKKRINKYAREYQRELCKNPRNKLDRNISRAIHHSIGKEKNGRKWETLVGYTVEDLMKHIEKQFSFGMDWNNYGKDGWHIDHIIPKSYWEYTLPEDSEFKQCWALANLQPLWQYDNLCKGNRYGFV